MVNKQILVGRVGRVDLKSTKTGTSVLEFSVATNEKWTDAKGQRQERVDWHNCVLFGKSADAVAKYMSKGIQVYVEGQTRHDTYEKDGQKRISTKVMVDDVQIYFDKVKSEPKITREVEWNPPMEESDIPF